jgi:HTH-type transcriptional regulator / antitoxin HipB
MIQNEYQYKVTKSKIGDLARVLTTLATEAESLPPLMVEATRNGFQTQINRMQTELQEYDDLKAGKIEITMSSIEDLPKVLIQKRISLGMTQRELAEKLGIKEQMVQRYESTAYESISYQRLIDVWNTLKTSIPMMVVR